MCHEMLVLKAHGAHFHLSFCVACMNLACVIQHKVHAVFFKQSMWHLQWVYHMIFSIMLHSYDSSLRYFTLSFLPQNPYIMLTLQPPIAISCHIATSSQYATSLWAVWWWWRWWLGIKMSHIKMKMVLF